MSVCSYVNVYSGSDSCMAQFADIWYTANGANYGRNQHYNDSRYHMLNFHATFTKGTIEFRLFQFDKPTAEKKNGLHAGQLKSYIQLCLALSEMAKGQRTASPKPQQTENSKFVVAARAGRSATVQCSSLYLSGAKKARSLRRYMPAT